MSALARTAGVVLVAILGCESPTEAPPTAATSGAGPATSTSLPSSIVSTTSSAAAAPFTATTPNDFLKRGKPTFIVGTTGDDGADKRIAVQANLVRALFFPTSELVADTTIDTSKGPAGWPRNPILYGGPHMHAVLAALAPTLPFEMKENRLVLGPETFEGRAIQMVAVIPARGADAKGPGYPEFLLYAGTGAPGVGEINAGNRGREPVRIDDEFGQLATGAWRAVGDGSIAIDLGPRADRAKWSTTEVAYAGKGTVRFHELSTDTGTDDEAVQKACVRGLETVVKKLEIAAPPSVDVYLYGSLADKSRVSGRGGAGHAAVHAGALHVLRADPEPGRGMEHLVAHEGTHVLAYDAWGGAGSGLMGEGLAVWVSGKYAGVTLAEWKTKLTKRSDIATLVGKGFIGLPEAETYPQSGWVVEAAVKQVGLAKVREHLFPATALDWDEACKAAGTTSKQLQDAAFK